MKRIIFLILIIFFASCSQEVDTTKVDIKPSYQEVEPEIVKEEVVEEEIKEDFNQNLTDYEQKWLDYVSKQYPDSKIYLIYTDKKSYCSNCYDFKFKKDLEIIKLEIREDEVSKKVLITDDIAVEIKDSKVCSLFGGEWNTCPKVCNTDEEACNGCKDPVCEFDYNTIEYLQEGSTCGQTAYQNCDFGLKCEINDGIGTCVNK